MRAPKLPARGLIAIVALVAISAAACGSSSKNAATSTTPTTVASGAGTPTTVAGTPTTAPSKSYSGSSGGDFCSLIRNDQDAFNNSDIATKTPDDLKSVYTKLVPALEHAESVAPSAIKGDFKTFVTFFKQLNAAFASAGYNFQNLDPTKFANLDTPAIKTASADIEQYVTQVCHVTTPT